MWLFSDSRALDTRAEGSGWAHPLPFTEYLANDVQRSRAHTGLKMF